MIQSRRHSLLSEKNSCEFASYLLLKFCFISSKRNLPLFPLHHVKRVRNHEGSFIKVSYFMLSCAVPCGLVARIRGFHPRGPGSIPGMGVFCCIFFQLQTLPPYLLGQLQILLTPSGNETNVDDLLQRYKDILTNFKSVLVPKLKPITRKQYEDSCKHWPVNFHENKMSVKSMYIC